MIVGAYNTFNSITNFLDSVDRKVGHVIDVPEDRAPCNILVRIVVAARRVFGCLIHLPFNLAIRVSRAAIAYLNTFPFVRECVLKQKFIKSVSDHLDKMHEGLSYLLLVRLIDDQQNIEAKCKEIKILSKKYSVINTVKKWSFKGKNGFLVGYLAISGHDKKVRLRGHEYLNFGAAEQLREEVVMDYDANKLIARGFRLSDKIDEDKWQFKLPVKTSGVKKIAASV